jgi:hypothetical protein
LILLGLPDCRITFNFRDNSFHTVGYRYLFSRVAHDHTPGFTIFCDVLTLTSTICNVLTSGLNAIDIDYDSLVCVHQDDTRALAYYC